MKTPDVQELPVRVAYQATGLNTQNYDLNVAYVPSPDGEPIRGIAGMGIGSEGNLPQVAAQLAANEGVYGVAFIQALPFYKADHNADRYNAAGQERRVEDYRRKFGERIIDFSAQNVAAVADYLRQEHDAETLHGVGESQFGPALLETVLQRPEAVDGTLVLLHSLGTFAVGKAGFIVRMGRSALQRDQAHANGPAVVAYTSERILQDFARSGPARLAQFNFALGYQAAPRLADLRREQPNRQAFVVAGSRDFVAPPSEARALLDEHGVADMLHVIDASHSTLASPAGAAQMKPATDLWDSPLPNVA